MGEAQCGAGLRSDRRADPCVETIPARTSWLRGAVLAGAAAIGLYAPYQHLMAARAPFTFDVGSRADATYAGARPHLRAGDRIGIFLLNQDDGADMAQWYSAQYAIAPAIVVPLYIDDCLHRAGSARCRLAETDRILARRDPRFIAALRSRFGLVPTAAVGDQIFLGRGTP